MSDRKESAVDKPREPIDEAFDVYQRYRLVADVLGRLRASLGAKPKRLRVLDVGGRTAVLRGFDLEDDVALVDVEPMEGVDGLVLGDGTKLPFQDDAFDVVCAFDTLEHIPPKLRDAFVDECARVARSWVVLAGPYEAPEVVAAEETLQLFLKEKLAYEHRYLQEHRHYGLPDRARVEARLAKAGARVRALGHGNIDRWLAFLSLSFYLDLEPGLRELARAFFRFYNANLYASDHAPPVYRHVVIATLSGAAEPDLGGLLEPPVAPAGALKPFVELERELLAFDRVRAEWREEERKLRETIATLEAERDARDARIRELGAQRDALESRVEAETHATAAARAEASDLEEKLAFERGQVADRDAEIVRLAAALETAEAEREALRHALAARAAELADRERVLGEHKEVLAELKEVLAARDIQVADQGAHIANLEAHLRDRNAELKRLPMAGLRRVMWLFFGKPPTA